MGLLSDILRELGLFLNKEAFFSTNDVRSKLEKHTLA
jgi:hypothetical protein